MIHIRISGKNQENLFLALSIYVMNPHHLQKSSYSTWHVFFMIYNLAPWLCMKRMIMSTLISGPIQPGNDIDVYFAPLIEDLNYY